MMYLKQLSQSLPLVFAAWFAALSFAQDIQGRTERYGVVNFPVSCNSEAQQRFNRAATMLHSFFYPETIKAFNNVLEADPDCAMAYWGIAISQRPNPLVGPWDNATLKRGLDAITKGKTLAKTPREKDWLEAMELFFRDYETVDQVTRAKRYASAMEKVYVKYPEDTEAAVFYALALNETADHHDKTYAQQLKAAVILEKIDAQQPDHPGIAHYIIHSYDFEPLAKRGVPAADKYAQIAPSAPHAVHMPSHIYSMLGTWEKSIASNKDSLAIAKDYAAKHFPGASDPSEPHLYDFMEYAYLQLGQDREARGVVDDIRAIKKFALVRSTVDIGVAAVQARYVLERGAWAEAASLIPVTSKFPYAEAVGYFARAVGASRSGALEQARMDIGELQKREDANRKANLPYWAEQTEVLAKAASAWLARAEGKDAVAQKLMREAADLEDSSEKDVAMENRLFPAREQLGYLLLELNQPQVALQEFETANKHTPQRLRGYYGAAKAAQLSGDREKARTYFARLVALTKNATGDRQEIRDAKAFLGNVKVSAEGLGR
jgi:hypothetical protein